ncbi:ComEC/Rec2 family competence protein [Pelotomaculum propionicicum]|nr:ComEC/Rec2 family competence protein [Pelotomaculum propionicicum]NLI14110.1 MBL fold metallo-hydrolase [Peptococcaceae bacterium]
MKKLFIIILALIFLTVCAKIWSDQANNKSNVQSPLPVQTQSEPNVPAKPAVLKVHFIDVGQGDAILVQLPDGRNMLIDAAARESESTVMGYLRERGVDRIDFIVGTHPHEDHIGSLDAVIKNFKTGEVIMPEVTTNTRVFYDLLQVIKERGLSIKKARAGVSIFENSGLSAKLLAPQATEYESLNNYSAVIFLKYQDVAFLLTGDAESESEKEMLAAGCDVKAQVLKVSHHGSSSSTTAKFLQAVSPSYAVISVGAGNDYNHPHPAVLDRLARSGAVTLRTDQQGTIVFESDGKVINYSTSK